MITWLRNAANFTRNATVWLAPFIIFLMSSALLIYILGANFDKYLDLLRILIWPTTLLLALFFFRKVVTYLFFSMDEFNFFGAKGELKDIRQIIDERVEKRVTEEKAEEKRNTEIKTFADELEQARKSKDGEAQRAQENYDLAQDIFKRYQSLSKEFAETSKELHELRREKIIQESRARYLKEKFQMRRNTVVSRELSPERAEGTNEVPKGQKGIDPINNK